MENDMMNYSSMYNKLYEVGYRMTDKNCGGKFLIHICKTLEFNTILDIGCCMGKGSETALKYKKQYTGVDVADLAVERATARGRNVVQGSICDIPFEDETFDVAFSSETIEHIDPGDIDLALNEMIRVAKKYIVVQISTTAAKRGSRTQHAGVSWVDVAGLDIKNMHLTIWSSQVWLEKLMTLGLDVVFVSTSKKNISAILRK